MKTTYIGFIIVLFSFCKTQPSSDRHYADGNPDKVYNLRLNPVVGSQYYYSITNESHFKMEVSDKKIDNQNKSAVGMSYVIGKDSTGNLLLNMAYDKIRIYTKN